MQPLSTIHPPEAHPASFLQVESSPCANAACIRRGSCGRATLRAVTGPYLAEATTLKFAPEFSSTASR